MVWYGMVWYGMVWYGMPPAHEAFIEGDHLLPVVEHIDHGEQDGAHQGAAEHHHDDADLLPVNVRTGGDKVSKEAQTGPAPHLQANQSVERVKSMESLKPKADIRTPGHQDTSKTRTLRHMDRKQDGKRTGEP